MKHKIFFFNVIFLIYLASLTFSNGQSPTDRLPDGAIARFSPGASVYTIAFSPNGQLLASGGDDNAVILWDVTKGHELKVFTEHTDWVKSVAFSPDGQLLASASMDGSVKLWSVSSDRNSATLKHSDWVESVTFSPNGQILATSGNTDGSIALWDVSTKHANRMESIIGHRSGVSSIAFSPDGLLLASAGDDDTVRLWNVPDRSEIKSITQHSSDVHSVVFSPDGQTLASGGKDNTVKLWEVSSKNMLASFEHDYVHSIAFSPDGQTLASASADYTVKLWSTSDHLQLAVLKGHRNGVTSVAFSPDGQTLATSGKDGDILIWDLTNFGIESPPMEDLTAQSNTLEVDSPENPPDVVLPEKTESSMPEEDENLLSHQDTVPPTLSIDAPVTEVINVDADQFTVRGSVTDNRGVSGISVNDMRADVSADGVFAATVPLTFGENRVRIVAMDRSGNMNTHLFTIFRENEEPPPPLISDTTPPTISFDATGNVVHVTTSPFTVRGSVTDDRGVSGISVNDMRADVSADGIFAATVPLTSGENRVRVIAMDTSGNMGTHQFTVVLTDDLNGPEIRIRYPVANFTRGVKAKIYLTEASTRVSGTVTDPSGVVEVKVNGVDAQVTGDDFMATVQLAVGENIIRVTAKDRLDNRSEESIAVVHGNRKSSGTNYALLFAVESYIHWNSLRNPLFDATAIHQDLKDIYGFQVEVVIDPTRARIVETLRKYAGKQYTDEDQLFIFFAGHGHFDKEFKEGYFVAQDTKIPDHDPSMGSYLSHSEFRNIVDKMSCKHIFLVMDTCYSGTFDQRIAMRGKTEDVFKPLSRADIKRKLTYTTRWYLTSGDEKVDDGVPGQHSPFARELLEALRSKGGRDDILTIDEVLFYLKKLENPKPRASGFGSDEPGSDFLFIAR